MLHLLPVRYLLVGIIALVALAVLSAVYAGFVATGSAIDDIWIIIRASMIGATVLATIPLVAWRWIPSLQRITFPYLGGVWAGELKYRGPNGEGDRKVELTIYHSLARLVLILESAESTSRTLVAHAERAAEENCDRMYYVFRNERKEGVPGARVQYRGLAILRVQSDRRLTLDGDYFTERLSSGQLHLRRRRSHPWWAPWK